MKHLEKNLEPSILSQLRLFHNVSPESIEAYLERSIYVELREGDVLLSPEKDNQHIFSLVSGRLHIHLRSIAEESYTELNPGECVGEMSIIEQREPSAYVVASEDSEVMGIDQDTLWAMVNSSHTVARNLLYILSGRLRQGNILIADSIEKQHRFEREAKIDALTGLHNRRWMDEMFGREIHRCAMDQGALCLAMLDVDNFKRFNDDYGHLVGDHVLSIISDTFQHLLRPNDMVARYAGDEFAVLLPQTDMPAALLIAGRLKEGIAALSFGNINGKLLPPATISIGLAQMQIDDTLDTLLSRADMAMYRSKRNGHDFIPPPPPR